MCSDKLERFTVVTTLQEIASFIIGISVLSILKTGVLPGCVMNSVWCLLSQPRPNITSYLGLSPSTTCAVTFVLCPAIVKLRSTSPTTCISDVAVANFAFDFLIVFPNSKATCFEINSACDPLSMRIFNFLSDSKHPSIIIRLLSMAFSLVLLLLTVLNLEICSILYPSYF